MAGTLREILAKAHEDAEQKRKEFKEFLERRNPAGAAIALSIQRDFTFPGDDDTKPDK